MTLLNLLLRDRRVHILTDDRLASSAASQMRKRLRDQLEIYSMQFKVPDTVFQRGRYALSGKVGGMKDDLVICLQLGVYWTETGRLNGSEQDPMVFRDHLQVQETPHVPVMGLQSDSQSSNAQR
eukprot:95131-Rhodomonas_salina.1